MAKDTRTATASNEPPTNRWVVGLYGMRKDVKFHFHDKESEAQDEYDDAECSRVLLNPNQSMVSCSTAWWDKEGVGVALLLQGPDSKITEEEVRKGLETGELPFVPPSRSQITQLSLKAAMKLGFGRATVSHFASAPYRNQSLCFYDVEKHPGVRNHVALTLDDAPCRFGESASELPRVRELFSENGIKATFMLVGSWCTEEHREDLVSLLRDGHEFGNHGMLDQSYEDASVEEFQNDVDKCSNIIQDLQMAAGLTEIGNKWFRAPHGRYTKQMAEVLEARNMTNVMCDTYASCPVVQDGEFIAKHLTETCQDGSIILIHMPGKYVRQWCWTGLVGLVKGLKARQLNVVTVGELTRLAQQSSDN